MSIIKLLEEKVYSQQEVTFEEAVELLQVQDEEELLIAANRIREKFCGNKIELCSIMNAKSGKCSENCKYCAQSAHYSTGVKEYGLVSKEEALALAIENEREGVHKFSLVTSGRGIYGREFERVVEIYKYMKDNSRISLCASHGIIDYEQFLILKEAGVKMYHHNLETSRRYYPNICSTHSYDDRITTIKNAQKAGLEVCSGGIIGMGESVEDRISMAMDLRELRVKSVPVNILNPIAGTPMEKAAPLTPKEVLRTIAVFRFILPDAYVRYAGGRSLLGDYQVKGLKSGINAALVGNLLTTVGNNIEQDKKMIINVGFEI